jgi:hypothetical protein
LEGTSLVAREFNSFAKAQRETSASSASPVRHRYGVRSNGGVGYRINEKWGVFAGYRAMRVKRENGWFLYDIT